MLNLPSKKRCPVKLSFTYSQNVHREVSWCDIKCGIDTTQTLFQGRTCYSVVYRVSLDDLWLHRNPCSKVTSFPKQPICLPEQSRKMRIQSKQPRVRHSERHYSSQNFMIFFLFSVIKIMLPKLSSATTFGKLNPRWYI